MNLSAQRLLSPSVLRPSTEYSSEVWKCKNVRQVLQSPFSLGEQKGSLNVHLGSVIRQLSVRGNMGGTRGRFRVAKVLK